MKILNYGNLAIVFSLISSLILNQFNSNYKDLSFILGLFIMPAYQVIVGFIWFMTSDKDKKIRYYFTGVLCYFFMIFCISFLHSFFNNQQLIENLLSIFGSSIPIILALYFTYILNQHSTK